MSGDAKSGATRYNAKVHHIHGSEIGALFGVPFGAISTGESLAVEPQPYCASVGRVIEALRSIGTPLSSVDVDRIKQLIATPSPESVLAIESILDHYTLMKVHIDHDGTAATMPGGSSRELVEQGWRSFLIRVDNRAGFTTRLTSISDAAVEEGGLLRKEE